MSSLNLVKQFHEKFEHPVKDRPDLTDTKLNALRVNLIEEELNELVAALEDGDKVATLDALTDLQYVLDGAYLALGFRKVKQTAINEVHSSNMSKLGCDGNPIYREDGKILKGIYYFEPDIEGIIKRLEDQNEC